MKRTWCVWAVVFSSCALIDAANGPFEPQTCAFIDCTCIQTDVGCDPQFSCDPAPDCSTCVTSDDCEDSECGSDGVCFGCQDYVPNVDTDVPYVTSAETYYCEASDNPTYCVRSSCVTFY